MRVQVRVFGGLERYLEKRRFGEPFDVDLEEGTDIRNLLYKLGLPEEQVFSALIDGQHRELDYVLQEGQRISLFPPVGGG